MEQNQPKLNQMPVGGKYTLTSDIMRDVKHSKHFQRVFQRSFFSFISTLGPVLNLSIEQDALKMVFKITILTKHDPQEFVHSFMLKEFKESKHKSDYIVLFQNAFIYAVASCYKSQIIGTYMRASEKSKQTDAQATEYMITGKVNGSYLVGSSEDRARHSNKEYVGYVDRAHPLFAKFVKSKHRFQYTKILAVAGYLINREL